MHNFTFQDLSGRRKLRRYVIASLAILLFLLLFASLGLQDRRANIPAGITGQPALVAARVTQASPTALPPEATGAAIGACPQNPDAWTFLEVFPGDHYRRIEPACVHEGIERVIAWMLAGRLGYSKPEAAGLLGFEELPEEFRTGIMAYSNLQGPVERELLAGWPPHPDFFFWQLDREGGPSAAFSLRGCYRLQDEVHCVLALDRAPGSAVSVLGDVRVASHGGHLPASRAFYLLVYREDLGWQLIGQLADATVEVPGPAVLVSDREQVTARLGTEPWDAAWLFSRFGISMKPLPSDWRLLDFDQEAARQIADELNRYHQSEAGETDE